MEMPGRRPQPYISDFTTAQGTELHVGDLESPLYKARSNKELSTSLPAEFSSEINLSRSKSKSQEAGLYRAVSATADDQLDEQYIKEFKELIDLIPFKKKYSSITVPVSVKYSTMAYRPRSPKRANELEQEQEKMQDELDQAILHIREQLGLLTTERVTMEKQMDELTTGINEARIQCHDQCRQRWLTTNSVARRGRSSTYTPHAKQKKGSQTPSPPLHNKKRQSSPGLLSPDSIVSNPDYLVQGHKGVSVTDSGYGSLNRKSKSAELRVRSSSFTSTPNVSLSQGNENYGLLNGAIPELPESPCFSQPSPSTQKRRERFDSTPTLHYHSSTVPKHSRSYSTSYAPPLINVTSSPDLSSRKKHDGYTKPPVSHRNSLPESVMNKIVEDEVDFVSVSDSLSQASLSQLSSYNYEEGSPKSHGSTVIVRRSSLTGQVEHIRRPRERNSFNERSDSVPLGDVSMKSSSSLNLSGADFRVLNTGYKKNRRRNSKLILTNNSIETTV